MGNNGSKRKQCKIAAQLIWNSNKSCKVYNSSSTLFKWKRVLDMTRVLLYFDNQNAKKEVIIYTPKRVIRDFLPSCFTDFHFLPIIVLKP